MTFALKYPTNRWEITWESHGGVMAVSEYYVDGRQDAWVLHWVLKRRECKRIVGIEYLGMATEGAK